VKRHPVRYLLAAVIQEQDVEAAKHALGRLNVPVFHLASTGGYLGRRNATLLIGLPEGMREEVVEAFQRACRQRVEYLAVPLEGSPLPLPTPVPINVGGAAIFVLPVERFEEF